MRLGRLKHYIKQIIPYRWVLQYEEKRDFFAQYFAWKDSNPQVEFDTESKWKNIVGVSGYGYSGSGAVVDLLREYDDCLVHGMAEGGSKATPAADDFGEILILKNAGGLLELDSVVGAHSTYFIQDEALKRFGKTVSRETIFSRGQRYRDYIFLFFDSMIEDVIRDTNGTLSVTMPRIKDNIFTLHPYTKREFYALCQRFLYSLFNIQYNGQHKYLILDQLVCSNTLDAAYARNFIPNMKNIFVWRDPRDIYVIAKELDLIWLEHDTVEHFIRRMKRLYSGINEEDKSCLYVRFEELIFDYNKTCKKIEEYLNLGEHKRPQSCLDTSISCKNIGMWKKTKDIPQEDFEKIFKNLRVYCYEGI